MTSRERRRERAGEQILEAAAKAIAENGFHGMTMRGLAAATGMSLANFYNYFGSKDDLLFELHERAFTGLAATAEQAVSAASDPEARLYRFIENHVGFFTQHTDVMRVLIYEASKLDREHRREVRELKTAYFERALDIVAQIFAERAGGAPDRAELERATYCVFGMMNWVYGWYSPKRHGPADRVIRTIHGMAMSGILGGAGLYPPPGALDEERAPGKLPSLVRRSGSGSGSGKKERS